MSEPTRDLPPDEGETLELILASSLQRNQQTTGTELSLKDAVRYLAGALGPEDAGALLTAVISTADARTQLRQTRVRLQALQEQDWPDVLAVSKGDPIAAAWVEFCREAAQAIHSLERPVSRMGWGGLRSLLEAGGAAASAAVAEVGALANQLRADLQQPRVALVRGDSTAGTEGTPQVQNAKVTPEGDLVVSLHNHASRPEACFLCLSVGDRWLLLQPLPKSAVAPRNELITLKGLGRDFGLVSGGLPSEYFVVESEAPTDGIHGRYWVMDADPAGQIEVLDAQIAKDELRLHLRLDEGHLADWGARELIVERRLSGEAVQCLTHLPMSNWRTEERFVSVLTEGLHLDDRAMICGLQFRLSRQD